jgi:hypothetical protein
MFLLISDGQICGRTNSPDGLPFGLEAIEYDGGLEPSALELVDGKICEKKPASVVPIEMVEVPASPWVQLRQKVQNTPIWEASFQASYKSLKAQSAWTLMLNSIDSSHNLSDFSFAVCALLEAAPEKFTDELKADFLELLEKIGLTTDDLTEALIN